MGQILPTITFYCWSEVFLMQCLDCPPTVSSAHLPKERTPRWRARTAGGRAEASPETQALQGLQKGGTTPGGLIFKFYFALAVHLNVLNLLLCLNKER